MAVPNPKHSLGEYGWVWDAICWVSAGEAWPSGDEDRMRELADAWQSLADLVGEVLTEADPAVMKILQSWGGGAGEAFGALWNQVGVDPNTGLPLIQEIAAAYASGCDQAALEIEYAKLTVLIAVIITVIAVFVALLMAWLGGVSAGAIPGILAAGRQAVTVAFRRLIAQLGRQLLTRAGLQAALRTAGGRVGQIVTSQGFRQGLNRLGLELMEEIGEELIIDVGAQAYQMRSGERRQWDGNRTLTAGVGGAYGAVLGSGMNWAGRRVAPKMPVSFSPSRLSFPGSGLVRWGSTSIASGAQNALISPAASVLANASVNQQLVLPGADAFLGGFASGAGRTGATLAGGATGNLGAKVTNLGLDRLSGTTTPGAGLGAGLNPSPGIGNVDLGNLGNTSTDGGSSGTSGRGSSDTDTGTVQDSGGTVPQSGAGSISLAPSVDPTVVAPVDGATSTSGPATTTEGVDLASGATDPNSTDATSRGDESSRAGRDDPATTGGRVPTDGTPAAAEPAGDTNRDSTTGDPTTPVADTPADRATSDPTDQAGPAERADGAPPTDQPAAGAPDTATDPTGDRGQSSPADTTGDRAPGSAADTTGDQAPNVDTTGDRVQSAPVNGTGDRVQSAPVDTSVGNARTVPVDASGDSAQSVPVDASAGAGRTVGVGPVPDSGVGASVDGPGGPAVSGVDPLAAEIAPAVVPGAPPASPVAGPTPGNVTPATTLNPAQTTAVPSATTPAATPTAPAPTTPTSAPGTPTAGASTTPTTSTSPTSTTPATGNNGTQPTPRAPANTTAPNSAGSVSLTPPPSAAPVTQPNAAPVAQPDVASVAPPEAASAPQSDGVSVAQPDTGPAVRPTAPAETAGTDSAPTAATTDPTVTPASPDGATDPAARRADQADQSATGGPVVVAVPGSTGTLQPGGPTAPDTGRGPVNPDTLRRSEGPTGNGTHSWQLAPTAVDGDPTGPDAEQALIEASRTLAEATRQAVKDGTISRAKQPGTSGALLMPDGGITTHTSMTADKGTKPPTQPSVHPLAQAALDRTKAALPDGTGSGHGKCAEVALVSDQLYRLETQWREAGEPGSFEQYALDAFNGAKILTHQVKPAQQNDIVYNLGHHRPPCRSCAHFLPQFAIEPIVDPERDARTYQPPVPGVVGNGPPLSDNRPYGDPNGLVPPEQADQQALDAAVPRDATTGRPLVHPDPRVGSWAGLVNDGGPTVPGRDNNCADVGLSVLDTWFGRPEVAAPTATSAEVEAGSTARQEQALRTEFAHQGTGTAGLDAVADALRAAGPGSAALIITTRPDGNGAHTWNAVNHDGTIIWLDGQNQLISDTDPVHGDPGNVWSIVLDAEGDPHRPAATDTDIRPPAPPDSTAPDDTSATTPDPSRPDMPGSPMEVQPGHVDEQGGSPAGLAGTGSDGLSDADPAPEGDPAASPYLDGLAEPDQATLHEALADAQRDADQILADLHGVNAEVNVRLGLTGADALSTLGEQHRVKGAESLARKFRTEMEPLGYDLGSALDTVNDVVRFSVQGPETEAYGPAVDAVLSSLEAQGYRVTDLKNFWHPGNRFFGLNCTLTSPTGRTFELQFPTATSYAIGKQTHLPYEVMRDPAQTPSARVHAFLDILTINKANGIAAHMPGGMDSGRFDTPKNTSFAKWMSSARQESIRQSYLDWLGQQGQTFADVLAARGLTASDLPGLDPDLMGGPHDGADVRLLPPAETGRPDGPAGQPDRGGGEFGADPGGDLGSSDGRVDVPPGRGGGDPVGESGAPRDRTGRPGDGGTPGGALHDGAAADGDRVDGDLPPGDLSTTPVASETPPVPPGSDATAGATDAGRPAVSLGTDRGLSQTRRIGPGELAPLEDPSFHWDVEQALRTPQGHALFADPSTNPYGGLINDGGPDRPGRGNNCLDCSLSALSSFYGDPQVSFPRWSDVRPDGSIDTVTGEASGLDRAESWLGGTWAGGPAGLPTTPAERAAAVSAQYARLHQHIAEAGPGSAALVVAEWVKRDRRTGDLLLDNGNVQVEDSHALVLVYPQGAEGPVWWDPQRGMTWPQPPTAYVAQTYALWSMTPAVEGIPDDGGRGADADQAPTGYAERDRAASVRVRLAGEGTIVSAGTGGGSATGPRELHHRPERGDHSADESAGAAADLGVHPGAPGGPDDGSSGLADGDTDRLTATAPSLEESRRFGPGELAPLEDPRFHDDLAASLATPHGYAVFADPSTHPYGGLVNDGGPDQPGRGNNCLDSSLSALASFHGDPQVSRPRWPDRLPDGSIDRLSGERGGLERAEAWIGGQWIGGPDGLPTDLSARTEAVAAQYADLYQQVADAGPGASALVVADWLLLDDAGDVVLDDNGQPEVDGSHAFVIVFPADADAPVWWDPQTGTASVDMPAGEVRDTHALWAMMVPDGEGRVDRGRGVDADQPVAGDRESDSASGVRVRLAGPGEALGTGTVRGDGSGAGQLHHRPDGSDHGSLQPAPEADHGGVHPGATRGSDQGSAGLAPTGTEGLTDPDGLTDADSTFADGRTDAADHNGPPAPPGADSDPTPADGPDLRQAAAGTTFGGALLDTDPARTAQAVQEALTAGPLPEQASVDPAAATVTLDTADGPYQVRIVLADPPAGVPAVPVATVGYTADGAVVQVSTGAHPDHVRRAVSAILAEVDAVAQERAVDLRTDATTALAEGARPEYDGTRVLTARDIGRLAELRVVLADSAATTDPARAGQLQAEALSLLVASGLLEQDPSHAVHGLGANVPVVGAEAAQARLDLIRSHLGPAAPAIENLIGQATGQQLVADLRAARSAIRAEARTWAQQATASRNAADLALTTRVDTTLDIAPEHVFGRLVIGGGWAATADFVTMGGAPDTGIGLPPVLCVSQGHDPWAERQALLMGQIPSELELPGMPFQPADLAEAGTQFTPSDVFADAVGAARALSGMPTYQGTATAITPRPADAEGWPDGANFRVTVGGRQFFTASVDVASGPGPSRVPNAPATAGGRYVDPTTGYRVDRSGPAPVFRAPDGTVVDPDTLPATVRTVLGAGVSHAPLLADFDGRPTDPLVVDPTSGYAVDPTTGQVFDPDGAPVDPDTLSDEVRARLGHAPDGSFGDPRPAVPAVDFGGQNLADAYRPGDRVLVFGAGASGAWDIEQAVASQASSVDWSARAVPPPPDQLTGDPGHDAEAQLRFSFGGGYNRRNTLPEVGAYAESVRGRVEQSLREIVSLRHTVDGGFLVEFTDGSRQAYDRVVFSIGQAPEYPGGVADLLSEVDLSPLHGPATAHDGPADVLGLRDTSGQLRVLGGASVAGPLLAKVGPALRQTIVDQAAALPDDSRGIPPSIRFHAQRIAEANLGAPPVPPGGQPTGGTGPDTSGGPSDLVPAGDTEQSPTPLDVEPGQRTVPVVEFPAERRHLDSDGPAVDVLPDALGDDLDGVAPQLDVTQGGQLAAGGEGLGTGRPDATVGQAQPPQPTQVRGAGQRADAVVTDRVVTQVEGDQTSQSGDTGDVRHQPGRVDKGQVADGKVGEDLGTVVDEGAGGHRDQLDESVADLPVDEQVGDRRGEPRDDSSVPQGGGPVGPGARQVDADHLGVVGVGGLDGVGVAPAQVEVVGVGQDGGVQLGGRGHDGSVSTTGSLTASAVPGSTFHGLGRPDADPGAVLDTARVALPQVAPYAQVDAVVPVGPDRFEIRPAGQHPLTVRLTAGPLADGVVAQSVRNPDGTFTVTVSERAVDQAVVRALAHEVAELVALNEAGRALVGPLDPGNVRGPIDASGLTAHDRGRLAEIRLLAAGYATADAPGRLAVRAEIDALAEHLGLRVGDQGVRARWALLPRDVLAHLMQLSVPALTPEAVSAVLAGAPALTEVERVRLIDYRSRLAPDFQVPQSPELAARMRELAAEAEHTQSGMPRMPAFAGQIIGIPPAQLDRVRAVDPQLADRLAREGVYVDLTGRYDLRPYMADVPAIDLGAARPAYDLSTEAGRQAQLHEDRQRSRAALRALRGGQAATLLADHDFHYQGTARWMGLVPDVLTDVLRGITPVPPTPATSAESASTQGPSGDTQVVADRVTLPPDSPTTPGPAYGPALDARTGQPAPLFDGPPRREDVQQGALGDCGMIAVIGAVAGHLPDTIAQMFHPNPDGSVDVLLHEASGPGQSVTPTGRQLRVTVWPDVPLHANSNGRSAYADQSTVGSSWASLLEKAIAAVDRTWTEQRHDQWQQQWSVRPGADPHQAAPLGYARLDNGSSRLVQTELLTQLTGLPSSVSRLDPTPGREAEAEARLATLLSAGSPVITGTLPAAQYPGKPPYGLIPGHAYEVVSVANGEVQLRNPWNASHPTPMPVRAFLDLMSPWYGHVEVAQSSVAALPDSDFHGQGRPAADPTAVLDRARLVLPTLADTIGADQITAVEPDVFEVRAGGLAPLRVQVTTGALTGTTVAQTTRNLDGTFTLTVSDRAVDAVVDRAVAHEFAELLARHESGQAQVGLFDQGTPETSIDPAGLTARDRGRLAELRVLAAGYPNADPSTRLVLRREIDALVDQLGLHWGTPDAPARLALLPADAWHHVIRLSVPKITPEALAGVLAVNPDPNRVERFRAIDYRARLATDLQPPSAAEITNKLRELAVHGERSQSSLPRMPALAGQVVALPPAALDAIRQTDPQLADRLAAEGVYVDLTGRFDLRPYTLDGAPEFPLDVSAPAFDLTTESGRRSLLAEDRSRVAAAFRAAYGSNPAAMAVLSTHGFHYVTDARLMALVPNALTDALRAMLPPDLSTIVDVDVDVEIEIEPTVSGTEVAVVADRVTLPDPDPNYPVRYGLALDDQTGQPAPLFAGPPHREQVSQGVLGDCGMLATMAAVAGHRPDALAGLFQPNSDGTVDVLLHESALQGDTSTPTGRRVRITVRPDVPLHAGSMGVSAYADRSVNGTGWASVLEKALAAVDRTWTMQRHEAWQRDWTAWRSKDDPHRAAPLGYARLHVGSTSYLQAELITQLTGVQSRMSVFDTRPGQEAVVAARLGALLAAGSPVISGTLPETSYPPGLSRLPFGLYAQHAYEVVSVTNGLVQLRNPWGDDHPAPIPVRDFLDLMASDYAHMDVAGTSSASPTASVTSPDVPPTPPTPPAPPAMPLTPSVPVPRSAEPAAGAASDRPRQHTLGRTDLEDERADISYLALLDGSGTVIGLSVLLSSGNGQREARWTTSGEPGIGGSVPVGRGEAERIAREVLGFRLPEESALHEMIDG